jgi:hypothetical protein
MDKKVSQDELAKRLNEAASLVTVGADYRHYKGNAYTVTGLAIEEKTNDVSVIYHATYDTRLTFVRPVASWIETVTTDDTTVQRFVECKNT